MSPEIKAKELIELFMPHVGIKSFNALIRLDTFKQHAKKCALITVNELIKNSRDTAMVYDLLFDEKDNYWIKVKAEILKS